MPTAYAPPERPTAPGYAASGSGEPSAWGPPTATVPPVAPTEAVPPVYGIAPATPPGSGAAGVAPPTPRKKSRVGLVVGLVVVLVLLIGAGLAAVLLVGGGATAELTVDSCEIAADGSLIATGSVTNGNGDSVGVDVSFLEVSSGDEVQADTVTVLLLDGSGNWSSTGSAGDSVTQVTCEATLVG